MDPRMINALERRLGYDLNGDGYIGGEGYMSKLERATGRDINGDGILGRHFDVMPGTHGRTAMPHNPYGQMYAANPYMAGHFTHPAYAGFRYY